MPEEKKTVELKEEELEKVSGGAGEGDTPKFSNGQQVKYVSNNVDYLVLEIVSYTASSRKYHTTVVSILPTCSPAYANAFNVGDTFVVNEDELVPLN